LILVDLDVPDDVPTALLDEAVARWAQGVRYSIASAEPDVNVGMARAHVMNTTSDAILSAMVLAHEALSHE